MNNVKGQTFKSLRKSIPDRRSSTCKDLRQERAWHTGGTARRHSGWEHTQPDGRKRAEAGGTGRVGHKGPVAIGDIWTCSKCNGKPWGEPL